MGPGALTKWLRRLHRWVGLALLLPLMVQGVTGTILVLEPLWPEPGGTPTAAPLSFNALQDAALAAMPAGMRLARLAAPQPGGLAAASFAPQGRARGGFVTVQIDPGRMAPVGKPVADGGVLAWVRGLHNNLLVPEWGGRSILGWEGVLLTLLIVLGIPLWWPRQGQVRAAFTIAPAARGVRFHRRLHGAVGIWILPVLLTSTLTGVVLGFPQASRALLGLPAGGLPRPSPGPAEPPPRADLDRAAGLAMAAVPGTAPRMVILPASARDPLRLMMSAPGGEGAVGTAMATLTADGGRLLSAPALGSASAADLALRWAHDLHQAQGLGWGWRVLNALAGLSLPLFGVTGLFMWLLKRRNRRRAAAAQIQAMQPGGSPSRA